MLPMLYVVRMDVEASYLDEFVKWYDTRHAPDLIRTGFHSCSAYHAVRGGPFICNVYEIDGVESLASDAYVAVRQNDVQLMDEVMTKISNHSNTCYVQDTVTGVHEAAHREGHRPSRAGAVTAPVVSTLRLDVSDARVDAMRAWFAAEDSRAREAGALRSRLARQDGKHPLFPSSQPEWIVVTEWAAVADALAYDDRHPVEGSCIAAIGDGVSSLSFHVGVHSATLLNASTWTS